MIPQGAPYKFGVKHLSKAFKLAPMAILKVLKRLTWAGEYSVDGEFESFEGFNELLSIGYFEKSHISVSQVIKLYFYIWNLTFVVPR
jgi:hypothetical protein